MSNEHSNAVRKSDLYEHGGTRKALLTEIGSLIFDAANPWGGLEPPNGGIQSMQDGACHPKTIWLLQ